jgi:hypothetical protein
MSTIYHRLPYESYLDTTGIKPALAENAMEFDHMVGRLHFLREKGMRVRTICLPHTEYQVALLPLDQGLERVALKGVRKDCTFDQDEGALWAQNKLAQDYTCHSIDLKSATDRFPRKLQLLFVRNGGLFGKLDKCLRKHCILIP